MLGSVKTKLPSLLWLAEWKKPAPLGQLGKIFGTCLRHLRDNFETTWKQFWNNCGELLGTTRGLLRVILGVLIEDKLRTSQSIVLVFASSHQDGLRFFLCNLENFNLLFSFLSQNMTWGQIGNHLGKTWGLLWEYFGTTWGRLGDFKGTNCRQLGDDLGTGGATKTD